MSMKSILAPIDGGKSTEAVLQAAFVFAREFGGHVKVLHVQADPKAAIPLLGEGMSGAMIEDMISLAEKEGNEKRAAAESLYRNALQACGATESTVPVDGSPCTVQWHVEQGRDDEVIASYGRLCDLILVPKPVQDNEVYTTLALNAALFETGRPMLLLPEKELSVFPKTVAICWNGSMEGSRAVGAAMALIQKAEKVFIMTADTSATKEPVGRELEEYLAWHGIDATSVFFSPAGKTVGEALLAESERHGCDIMVMGGYTHSRMRELIMGGATRDVIESATIPVLMGH